MLAVVAMVLVTALLAAGGWSLVSTLSVQTTIAASTGALDVRERTGGYVLTPVGPSGYATEGLVLRVTVDGITTQARVSSILGPNAGALWTAQEPICIIGAAPECFHSCASELMVELRTAGEVLYRSSPSIDAPCV